MEKRVNLRWKGDLEFEATTDAGNAIPLEGGPNSSTFRPSALVLAGLASCTGMDALSIMQKKRQRVETYEVQVVGQQRDEHPKYLTSIEVLHVVHGTDIDDAAVARAIELSARKYCAVGATLAMGDTTITHAAHITDGSGERAADGLTIGPRGAGLDMGAAQ